ncbi:hypothetical protein M9Y10_028657 [Tritrichomonas musculus]|uniref:CUE domain-containing protein n=1 Tax=Tritrichomonas musculus TaxID=1915356 RepID=A0ABR2KKH2_9EUKA
MEFYPKSLKEAEDLFSRAIVSDDYELAEEILKQIPDLQLLEDETQLGHLVDNYLIGKEALSEQVDSNCINYEKKIQNAINQVQKDFTKQFNSLKKKQESELKAIYEQWKVKRDEIEANSLVQYEDSLVTARLLASQTCFKEAKAIRDTAYRKKTESVINSHKSLSNKYRIIIQKMMERHEVELNSLIKKRDFRIQQINLEKESAQTTAVECFEIDNADNVVGTVNVATKPVPLALVMQTKDNQPVQSQSEILMKSDVTFRNKMKTYRQALAATDLGKMNKTPTQKNKKTNTFRSLNKKRISTP